MQPIGPYNRWPPQVVPTTSLTITIANEVDYVDNVSDPNTFATNPNAVTIKLPPPDNFVLVTIIGDIVAVNGEAVRGTYVGRTASIRAQPAAIATTPPGWAIADISRAALRESVFEILKADGTTQIGTIMTMGLSGGIAPPGVPSVPPTNPPLAQGANFAIVGGTGAFLGARGQAEGSGGAARMASMTEDPKNRITNTGLGNIYFLHIIPMVIPEIVQVSFEGGIVLGPPPRPGGRVTLLATGLGPVNPSVDPGQPFPANAHVNSPITVTLNGNPCKVLSAVGATGLVGYYAVEFGVPADAKPGTGQLQLSAAWIASAPINIFVEPNFI